jgi:transcriptional regulator with XRE-family HTH domain
MKQPKNLPFRFRADLVAKRMRELGLDDRGLAHRLAEMGFKFEPRIIARYRKGEARPSTETLAALSDALGVGMREFVAAREGD